MGWFRRHQQPDAQDALGALYERFLTAQSNQFENFSKFLVLLTDLSAKKAASVLGTRGARVRKERAAIKRRGAYCCKLGENPRFAGPELTVELIQAHRLHMAEQPAREAPESNGGPS